MRTTSSGYNWWHLLSFRCLNVYDEDNKNYKLICTKGSYLFLGISSNSTDPLHIKIIASKIKVLHHFHYYIEYTKQINLMFIGPCIIVMVEE